MLTPWHSAPESQDYANLKQYDVFFRKQHRWGQSQRVLKVRECFVSRLSVTIGTRVHDGSCHAQIILQDFSAFSGSLTGKPVRFVG